MKAKGKAQKVRAKTLEHLRSDSGGIPFPWRQFSFSPDKDEFNRNHPGQDCQAENIRGPQAGGMGHDPAEEGP